MRFYIDFEATQFSNRIISIGCVCENGNTFKTLVQPVNKGKITPFITELTGITPEMIAEAPSADEAFNMLFDFIELNNTSNYPQFYVYGDSDAEFIKHTVPFMRDPRAMICAMAIQGNLVDYSRTVKTFFNLGQNFALRKVYMLICGLDELVQDHDALNDAKMLKVVVENLNKKCHPKDGQTMLTMASQTKPDSAKAPKRFIQWDKYDKWTAPTDSNENSWIIKAYDKDSPNKVRYFNSIHMAALWSIKYVAKQVSPKKPEDVAKVERAILSAINLKKCRYNCYWEYKPEHAIIETMKGE
jgi:DNA polymerase III epsilon subunit-like protein